MNQAIFLHIIPVCLYIFPIFIISIRPSIQSMLNTLALIPVASDQKKILCICSLITMIYSISIECIQLRFFLNYTDQYNTMVQFSHVQLKHMGFSNKLFDIWLYQFIYVAILSQTVTFAIYGISLACKKWTSSASFQWIVLIMLNLIHFGFFIADWCILQEVFVHILDVDLVNTNGWISTIVRQFDLGKAGLFASNNTLYIIIKLTISISVAALCLFRCISWRLKIFIKLFTWYHIIIAFIIFISIFYIFLCQPLSSSFEIQFVSALWPLNIWLKLASFGVYGSNQFMNMQLRQLEYPELTGNIRINTTNDKLANIVIITQESWTRQEWKSHHETEHLRQFIDDVNATSHACVELDHHVSGSRVTETAHFQIMYGLYPMYMESLMNNYITSYPMDILHKLQYQTGYFSAAAPFGYPNNFLIVGNYNTSVHDAYGASLMDRDLYPSIHDFLGNVRSENQTFMMMYHSYGHHTQITADEHKGNVLRLLNEFGLSKDSVFVFSNDHGIRDHDDDWASSKIDAPFVMCIPHSLSSSKPIRGDIVPSTTHIDIVPTFLEIIGIHKALGITEDEYSQGKPIWKRNGDTIEINEQVKRREFLYFVPRFFPKKSRIIGVLHIESGNTLHFTFINEQFGVRLLWIWDANDGIVCNGQQLRAGAEMCDLKIWDRAIEEFNSKKVYWKFWRREDDENTEYGQRYGSGAIFALAMVIFFMHLERKYRSRAEEIEALVYEEIEPLIHSHVS